MGKKKPVKKPLANKPETLTDLERQTSRLDREILELINRRGRLTKRIAELRRQADQPAYDVDTEQEQIRQLRELSTGPLSQECISAVFRELLSGVRALVRPLKVAYLGPQYSYSHIAAVERFGSGTELVPVATIAAVFSEVHRGQADFGLVPIENSTDGRVADTLSMFARLPVRICGEVLLHIRHNLLGKCSQAEVREVYSKPQALSQCREWLAKHLPQARTIEMASTAAAAQLAVDKPGAAAIASHQAAVNYGLNVIAADIQDNAHNITRFAVIGHQPAPRTGRDKTSLMFEILHRPGALADAMAVFKRNRLNLTWIESFPMHSTQHEYLFFVEFEGHQNDAKARRALTALASKTVRIEVLGSYARSEPV